jgi:hypothetical protein
MDEPPALGYLVKLPTAGLARGEADGSQARHSRIGQPLPHRGVRPGEARRSRAAVGARAAPLGGAGG